jgi:imidazolonepropionase-like amidohydrolase
MTLAVAAAQAPPSRPGATRTAFVGARIIDGTNTPLEPDAVLMVAGGRVTGVLDRSRWKAEPGIEVVDVAGRTIVPGLVNAHGHVGDTRGLESGPSFYTDENVRHQLDLYARYGVTTVMSLGGDGPPGFRAREAQAGDAAPGRARIFLAGPVITADTPEAARTAVDAAADLKPDFIKIRVDDNLGTGAKMSPDAYRAVIERAHARRLRVAAHIFYLDDAKALLRAGVDLLAHSVRDKDVDSELIDLMKARDVCLSPTLMREVSTFAYETRPAFFDDPFFRREADVAVLKRLEDPARQEQTRSSRAAQAYKRALDVAARNAKRLADAGVRLASGTDTGPPARFQGYFEHLELERLVAAGLTPRQALVAATRDAAACTGLGGEVGTLEPGKRADFLVLAKNPLDDIRHTRTIESVWIGGQRVTR